MNACSKHDNGISDINGKENQVSFVVTIDEAELELLSFMEEIEPMTKGECRRTIKSRFSLGDNMGVKSYGCEAEPYVHVFNFDNGQGFAIMSGDKRVGPVLCITDSGHLDESPTTDNPGFFMAMSNLDTYYRLCTGMPVTDDDGNVFIFDECSNITKSTIVPGTTTPDGKPVYFEYDDWGSFVRFGEIIECNWHQNIPFNKYCYTSDGQQALAGCFPIAVAQIMYYWKNSYSYNGTYWDWSKMKYIMNSSCEKAYPEAMSLVQRFVAALGDSNNLAAVYGTSGTSAYVKDIERTFLNFGYSNGGYFQNYDISTMISNISRGPVLMFGYYNKHVTKTKALGIVWKTDVTYSGGHLWVADEVLCRSRNVSVYVDDILDYTYSDTQKLVHCNWGWSNHNKYNGYYLYSRFDAVNGPETKGKVTETYGTDNYYQYNLLMNCDIRK